MSTGGHFPFEYTVRSRAMRDLEGPEYSRVAERRDRELEDFLATFYGEFQDFDPGSGGGGGDGSGFTFVQATVPTATAVGETWWNSSTGSLSGTSWVAIDEGSGELVWVQFAPGSGGGSGGGGTQTLTYVHNQDVAASTWIISHGLGWYPNVTTVDSSGSEVEGDLTHLSNIQLRIIFSAAFTGIAYLS